MKLTAAQASDLLKRSAESADSVAMGAALSPVVPTQIGQERGWSAFLYGGELRDMDMVIFPPFAVISWTPQLGPRLAQIAPSVLGIDASPTTPLGPTSVVGPMFTSAAAREQRLTEYYRAADASMEAWSLGRRDTAAAIAYRAALDGLAPSVFKPAYARLSPAFFAWLDAC